MAQQNPNHSHGDAADRSALISSNPIIKSHHDTTSLPTLRTARSVGVPVATSMAENNPAPTNDGIMGRVAQSLA